MKKKHLTTVVMWGITKILRVLPTLAWILLLTACSDDFGEKKFSSLYGAGDGVFIVCEGQFMAGNGSVSYYDPVTRKLTNSIFYAANNRPPGDIPQYLAFSGNRGYLVVNNSNRLEVVDLKDFKVQTTVKDLQMPRQILPSGGKAFISQTGSTSIAVMDMASHTIVRFMEGYKSSDRMLLAGGKLFVANWTSYFIDRPNNTIMVFNAESEHFIDSVMVTKEPNSLVKDINGRVWALSSGGYMNEEYPEICCINPQTLQVEKRLVFALKSSYPTFLNISPDGKTLYYVDGGLFKVGIDESILPSDPFIEQEGRSIYGFAVDPGNGDLYIADAKDYQNNGEVFRYSHNGVLTDRFSVGISPAGIFFYCK